MNKRTFWRRGVLPVYCLALLSVWAQTGRPQQPVSNPVAPKVSDGKDRSTSPDLPSFPVPKPDYKPTPMPPPAPVPVPTVEDLIKQLESLRKDKAELDKREKDLVSKLQERMKDQADRLNKLGIILPAPPLPVAPAAPLTEAKDTVDAFTPLLKATGGRDTEKK